jgi:PAS domain S-box-containing protein
MENHTNITVRESGQKRKVKIGSKLKPEITSSIVQKWQSFVDIAAKIVKVPSGLIMKLNEKTIEVFVKSNTQGNPYKAGEESNLIYGLYCETVIGTQKQLLIPDATKSKVWNYNNPDVDINMISYLGLPVNWPDGEVFGTVCLLDNKENHYSSDYIEFLNQVKTQIETDLQLLVANQQLADQNRELKNTIESSETLKRSDERFHIIFENSLAVMWIIDLETRKIVAANRAAEKFYGWSRAELERMRIDDINTLTPSEIKTEMEKARKSERIYFQFKHRLASGKIRDVEVYSGKVEIDGKDYLHSIIHDISEQKLAEKELRQSEQRFRMVFESANVGKSITLPSGEINVNQAFADLLGYSGEELKYKKWQEITPPEEVPEIEKKLKPILEGKTDSARFEKRYIHKNGSFVWADMSVRLIRDSENKPFYFITTVTDISKQKQTEEELRQSEERFKALHNASFGGIIIHDKGILVDFNQGSSELTGYTQEELKGMNVLDLIAKSSCEFVNEKMVTGYEKPYEAGCLHKSGKEFPVRIEARNVPYKGKTVRVAEFRDISEQKKAVEEQTKSLNLLNNLAAQVPGVVYQYRLYPGGNSAFPYASPGMWDIYEVTPEEVREDASPVFTRIHPDDYDYIVETITESAKNQTNYESEFRVILPEQGLRWRYCNAKPELLEDGSTLWHGIITDVTERKLAEEARQRSEEQYRTLFETMIQGVVYQSASGEIISANLAAEKILGLSIDQMKGRTSIDPCWKAVDENKNPLPGRSHPAMIALQTGKEVKNFTQGIFNPQKNEYVWILVNSIPQFKGDEKKPFQVFSTFLEITDRKKAEEALSYSHELMKYIIEHNKSAVAVHDKNLNYVYVSQRYLNDYRITDKNIIGKHHYEVFPDLPEKWRKVHQKALCGIVSKADDDKYVREDGSTDWTRWECRPWYEVDGSIGGIIVYTEVINEQKRKEEEIRKLNQRLGILIESIQQLSSAQSLDSVQDIVAISARRLIGADGATLVFKENDHCFYVNEDAIEPLWKGKKFPMDSCISGWVMENKKPVVIEDIFSDDRIPKDLYSATFVKSLAMVPVNISEPIGAIGNYWKETYIPTETEIQLLQTLADAAARSIENINLYAELELRVKKRTEQLQAANKELETFTYSVSHDLKAPLRGIDGYSKLLMDDYGSRLNEEASHFIKTIRSSTLQMNQLINDLLSYSRLERSEVKQEKIKLQPFVERIVSGFSDELQKTGATVKMHLPENQITADSTGLSIALRNFIENALKFSSEKIKPSIEIGYEEKPGSWIIFVKDNGVGFDMKYHDRIFDIFQRLHRAEDFPGTGIGLAMVAKAMQRMGGKTWAESSLGNGATFFIELQKKLKL